mmetsp:Transcript_88392/g.140641  ORF Transcript_88392/g.140641 Transcript_88392/m.140641 type:complete len:222 (-) Transcript_88392:121-786(-)
MSICRRGGPHHAAQHAADRGRDAARRRRAARVGAAALGFGAAALGGLHRWHPGAHGGLRHRRDRRYRRRLEDVGGGGELGDGLLQDAGGLAAGGGSVLGRQLALVCRPQHPQCGTHQQLSSHRGCLQALKFGAARVGSRRSGCHHIQHMRESQQWIFLLLRISCGWQGPVGELAILIFLMPLIFLPRLSKLFLHSWRLCIFLGLGAPSQGWCQAGCLTAGH